MLSAPHAGDDSSRSQKTNAWDFCDSIAGRYSFADSAQLGPNPHV